MATLQVRPRTRVYSWLKIRTPSSQVSMFDPHIVTLTFASLFLGDLRAVPIAREVLVRSRRLSFEIG